MYLRENGGEQMKDKKSYILLTPGPLTTTKSVKEVMMKDWCTWDDEYNNLVQDLRNRLLTLGVKNKNDYTTVLMQGSGTFSVESVIGSSMTLEDKMLIIANGAYGNRIAEIADVLNLKYEKIDFGEAGKIDVALIREELETGDFTHLAIVHCETTTGRLNPIQAIGNLIKEFNISYIVDAMSSFGGVEINIEKLGCDFLISSANKCIQGVPGFGFVIAKKSAMERCKGNAKSLSLDLYSQWKTMEDNNGKWRFTSPTHVVRAFYQALLELETEGGVKARQARYTKNREILVRNMEEMGYSTLVEKENLSPIITTFLVENEKSFIFKDFYNSLKEEGFVIYPGKITEAETFRIGNIGDIHPNDIERLTNVIKEIKS